MKEKLEALGRSPYGIVLRDFLNEEMKVIGDVDNTKSYEELLANQKVKKIVKKLFSFLENPKPSKKGKRNFA